MESATAAPPETETPQGDELVIEGSSQLSFDIGGKAPTTSSVRLTGEKVDVGGSFLKGERIVLTVECVVNDVGFKDQEDPKTGQVIGCERRHRARITGVEQA